MRDAEEEAKVAEATRLIARRWADAVGDDQRPPSLAEMAAIASSTGVRDPDAVGLELGRLMLETYVGVAHGVGPRARRRDRLRAWWSDRRGS